MLVGPVFTRELQILPRRGRLFAARGAYVGALAALMITAWQVLAGTQTVRNVGEFSYFGTTIFQLLAPLHLAAAVFFAALSTAAAVAHEKDRRTLDLLLLTSLTNSELVLGKLSASLLAVVDFTLAALPLFAILVLFGGVDFGQLGALVVVTSAAIVAAGSLGSTVALWREKSFQTLAVTSLAIVVWTGAWDAVARVPQAGLPAANTPQAWAAAMSPWHAVIAVARPFDDTRFYVGGAALPPWAASTLCSLSAALLLNAVAIWKVRTWNPSREILAPDAMRGEPAHAASAPAWSLAMRSASTATIGAQSIAVAGRGLRPSRQVWDNPILWRETMTWAYGRRVLVVRLTFAAVFAALAWALIGLVATRPSAVELAAIAAPVAMLGAFLINLQAVTAVTSERDVRAIDLLLVTDLTAKEFVFGKLGGILYNTKEMVLLPAVMSGLLWWFGLASGETAAYLVVGWLVVAAFAAVLGLHIGMNYANSRHAAAVSLATVFFLVVGVAVSMRIMVAFSGSFQAQLQPFLATIVGGGVGLYVALGRRNPSPAITLASFLLPLATFYALTSFLLEATLATLLAVVGAYTFTTAALLMPAVFEFDVATGRTTAGEERD
ncbi:MAG: ABC transporter permease [Planctomycetaceae bacterium]|nr:ABC transporter permease [Planctomycetaceae bacterium]